MTLVDKNGKPILSDDGMAEREALLLATLNEVVTIINSKGQDRLFSEQVVANLLLQVFSSLPPGAEPRWVDYIMAVLLDMFQKSLPLKMENDRAAAMAQAAASQATLQ
jgi:hypothetical protein